MIRFITIALSSILKIIIVNKHLRIFSHKSIRFINMKTLLHISTFMLLSIKPYFFPKSLISVPIYILAAFLQTLLYESSFESKVAVSLLIESIHMLSESVSGTLMFFLIKNHTVSVGPLYLIISGIILNSLFFIICVFVKHFLNVTPTCCKNGKNLSYILSIIILSSTFYAGQPKFMRIAVEKLGYEFISCVCLGYVSCISCMLLFNILKKNGFYNISYKTNLCKGRQLKHDLNNLLFAIQGYIDIGNYEKASQKISEFSNITSQTLPKDISYPHIVSLMNAKRDIAEKHGIEFLVDFDIRKQLTINEFDLCIVLGNALDNAIEACLKMPKKKSPIIKVDIYTTGNRLHINVANSVDKDVKIIKNEIITNKPNTANHGFGLKSIKEITAKNFGYTSINQRNKMFYLSIDMKI